MNKYTKKKKAKHHKLYKYNLGFGGYLDKLFMTYKK